MEYIFMRCSFIDSFTDWYSFTSHSFRVEPGDYLNTFAFLDKLAENLTKKQAQSRL